MKRPIGDRNPCNILHVVFSSFYPTILFLKGSQLNAATLPICVIPAIVPHIIYKASRGKYSFNNIGLCESNAVQIYELVFCDTKR